MQSRDLEKLTKMELFRSTLNLEKTLWQLSVSKIKSRKVWGGLYVNNACVHEVICQRKFRPNAF